MRYDKYKPIADDMNKDWGDISSEAKLYNSSFFNFQDDAFLTRPVISTLLVCVSAWDSVSKVGQFQCTF